MAASLILVLYFCNMITLETAIASLYISGILMLVAEFGVFSLGLLSLNALLSFYAAYALQTGDTIIMGADIGWPMVFGIAIAEFIILIGGVMVWHKYVHLRPRTGTDAMIGQKAVVVEWSGTSGRIQYEGEVWKAASAKEMDLNPKDTVQIKGIEKLTLMIES